MFNPTNLIDCLDEEACGIKRFTTGRIMRIDKHVFRTELLTGIDAFKIPNLRVSPLYVTRAFVSAWRAAGLEGLEWKRLA